MTDSTLAHTEAPILKLEYCEPAAPRKRKRATTVANSTSSLSTPKGAKRAPTTKKSPSPHKAIAFFIMGKFLDSGVAFDGCEIALAYKLAKRYDSIEFWKTVPKRNSLDSLKIIYTAEARAKLDRLWKGHKSLLTMQRAIKIETTPRFSIGEEKVGAPYTTPPRRPNTAIEFCR